MINPFDYPLLVLLLSLPAFWFSGLLGASFRKRRVELAEGTRDDLTFVLGGALTLLALITGFTFSMAVNRYDQRKNYEEDEANAIGTEYARANFLPSADAAEVRALLKSYLDERILHYRIRRGNQAMIRESDARTARLQAEMWSTVATPTAPPNPVTTFVASGMNDVLNSQGRAQAAWRNRIPTAAWTLLIVISIFCNFLIGYSAHGRNPSLLLVLPVALSISLFLIADIDSPRGGIISVRPENLQSLAESLNAR